MPAIPRARVRRSSVSAESDRPTHPAAYSQRPAVPKTEEQRARLMAATRGSILFSGLDREQQAEIIDAMTEVRVRAGVNVIRQGEEGDFFYIIEQGIFDVYRAQPGSSSAAAASTSPASASSSPTSPSLSSSPSSAPPQPVEEKVFEYVNRGSFGELALMYNCPRAATVRARTDGCLWRVDRETFRHIVIASTALKRARFEAALESVPLLANLSKQERAHVADSMETVTFRKGEHVIQQGETGESMFFVMRGELIATQTSRGGQQVEVGRIAEGGYFGERSLLTNEARAATVQCVSEAGCELGQIDRSAFERLLGSLKDIMHRQIKEYKKAEELEEQGGAAAAAGAAGGDSANDSKREEGTDNTERSGDEDEKKD